MRFLLELLDILANPERARRELKYMAALEALDKGDSAVLEIESRRGEGVSPGKVTPATERV